MLIIVEMTMTVTNITNSFNTVIVSAVLNSSSPSANGQFAYGMCNGVGLTNNFKFVFTGQSGTENILNVFNIEPIVVQPPNSSGMIMGNTEQVNDNVFIYAVMPPN
jgi:hypothetical protein